MSATLTRTLALLLPLWLAAPVAPASGVSGTNSVGMKFVSIAAGSSQMVASRSSKASRSKDTQHRVTLTKSFMMATTEVTQGQWRTVMGSNPSTADGGPFTLGGFAGFTGGAPAKDYKDVSLIGNNLPVQNVSWQEAVQFANALSKKERLDPAYELSGSTVSWNKSASGYRLPTEAEWVYAARGGQHHVYSGSDTISAVGWTSENSGYKTHKVAGKLPNAWGLYDMSGNVTEWCWDWYGEDTGSSTDSSGPQAGDYRVRRGGSWIKGAAAARVGAREWGAPDSRSSHLGLRLVRTNP
jgi:sulfatase modifying factor 1